MKNNKTKPIRVAAFLIPALAVLVGMILGGFAPFGDKDVLTAGGMSEYIPYFTELYDRVHNGESLIFSLKSGLGYDFTTVWSYYLSDPLNLLVLLFPKSAMLTLLNLLYLLKIGFAGLFFSLFLSYRHGKVEADTEAMALLRADKIAAAQAKQEAKKQKEAQKSRNTKKDFKIGGHEAPNTRFGMFISQLDIINLAFSVCYALSAYMLGQGLNVTWLSSVALFPLILMGLDQVIQERKWKLYTITYLISFYCSFYLTLVITVFSVLYFCLQDYKDVKHFLRSLVYKLLGDVIAVGGAMVIILNCVHSSYFKEHFSLQFPLANTTTSVFDVTKMMLPGILPSSVWSYANGIDIYCGIGALFLLFCYLFNRNIRLSSKIKHLGLFVLLFLGLFMVTPNYLLNGFLYSEYNVCSFGFLYVGLLLLLGYTAFHNMEYSSTADITLSAVLCAALSVSTILFSIYYESMSPFLTTLELAFLFYILTLIWKNKSMTKLFFTVSFGCIMLLESVITYGNTLADVGSLSASYSDTIDYKLDAAKSYLTAQDADARILVFEDQKTDATPLTNTLLGYDYVITEEGSEYTDSLLEYVETYQGVDIYRNPYVISNGFYVDESISDWDYNSGYPFQSLNLLADSILEDTEPFQLSSGEFEFNLGTVLDANMNVIRNRSSYQYIFTSPTSGDLYSNLTSLVHLGEVASGDTVTYRNSLSSRDVENYVYTASFAFFDTEAFYTLFDAMQQNATISVSDYRNTKEFTVESEAAGYLLLPMGAAENWRSKDLGTLSTTALVDEECLVVPLTAGTNQFTLVYSPTYFYTGLVVTILFLLVLVLLLVPFKQKSVSLLKGLKTGYKGLSGFVERNAVYFFTFLTVTVLFVGMLMYRACTPFGINSAVMSDGYLQTYPIFTNLMNQIRHGDFSLINYNLGFTVDNYMLNFGKLINPINWLFLLFPESQSLVGFNFLYYVRLVLSGFAIIFYLTHRPNAQNLDITDKRLYPIALVYNLSAFMVSYFCFMDFQDMAILIPLLILGMERLIYEKKCSFYILTLFYLMLLTPVTAFMVCEFLFLYFFTLNFDSIKHFIRCGIRFGLCSILSAALAAFNLIPFYLYILQSPYQSNDSLPSFGLDNTLLRSLKDLQLGNGATVIDEDFTRANTYVGLLVLLFLVLYARNSRIRLSQRIRKLALVVLYYFAYGNTFLNYVFHNFHYQSLVPNRFSLFFTFLVVVMFYDCVIHFEELLTKTNLYLLAGWGLLLIGLTVFNNRTAVTFSAVATIVVLLIYLIAIFFYHRKHKPFIKQCIMALLILELLLNSVICFKTSLGAYTYIDSKVNSKITALSKEYNLMGDLARTEYIDSSFTNNSCLTDTSSASTFSSMLTSDLFTLMGHWNVYGGTNYISYGIGNPLANMMLNIQYQITDDYLDSSVSIYELVDSKGNISLHKNKWALSAGIYFDDTKVLTDSYDSGDYESIFDYQNAFTQSLIQEDIYDEIPLDLNPDTESGNSSYCLMDTSVLSNPEAETIPTKILTAKDISGQIYLEYCNELYYLGTAVSGEQDEFELELPLLTDTNGTAVVSIACLNDTAMNHLYEYLAPYTMQNIRCSSQDISGDITVPDSGVVYVSLPNFNGWTACVDGEAVEIQSFLGGMGIPVEEGTHQITLHYSTPGLGIGIPISLIALLVFAAMLIWLRKNKKKAIFSTTE